MNHQLNSIFENLSSNLRKKTPSKNDKEAENQQQEVQNGTNNVNNSGKKEEKSKNIFKSFINYNGASTILSNLLKYPEMQTDSQPTTTTLPTTASAEKSPEQIPHSDNVQEQKNGKLDNYSHNEPHYDEASQQKHQSCIVVRSDLPSVQITKKRNSVVKASMEMDLTSNQGLSPTPARSGHRKSCHDIRLMKNNHLGAENGDEVKVVKPLKTRNIISKNETFDMLYPKSMAVSFTQIFLITIWSKSLT